MKPIEKPSLFVATLSSGRVARDAGRTCGLVALVIALLVPQIDAADQVSQPAVRFGIGGHYRIGCWTAIQLPDADNLQELAGDPQTIVETLDGDGMRVQYRQSPPSTKHRFLYAIPGSEAAPLKIVQDSETVISSRFPPQLDSPTRGPSVIPLGMPWIISLGDPLGVDTIGANELLGRAAAIVVSRPEISDLPDSELGYDGVDLIMISGSSHRTLQELTSKQAEAIKQWVLGGGRLFVTLGASTQQLSQAAPWLFDLLPLDRDSVTIRLMDPSAIETYTSTQQPLEKFEGVFLPKQTGRILITGRTARRVSTPMAAEYIAGFGRITVIAADLDDAKFATWPDRLALVTRLAGTIFDPGDDTPLATNRATAFNDLAGQMRATLDQFPLKRKFGFSLVALILMALIAAIGPLDFFLINRVLGRPLLGWFTFPLAAVALSGLLISQTRPSPAERTDAKPGVVDRLIRCNRLEIVDMDLIENVGRGFAWNCVYSHPASLIDVSVHPGAPVQALSSSLETMMTVPFGYPGRAFGGIQIVGEDARFPSYQVAIEERPESVRASLIGLSLAPRSSKSIATRFAFTPKLPDGLVMERRVGSELLQSGLENPFPFDLLDGMLIYRNWVYLLPTRFPAGAKIASVDSLQQRNFRWRLSRQTALEKNRTESESWAAARFDRPDRVAEMLMFHESVGGSRYTSLRDDPLSSLDLSSLLTEDRCILVGKPIDSCLELKLTPRGFAADSASISIVGQRESIIRLVIPVIAKKQR